MAECTQADKRGRIIWLNLIKTWNSLYLTIMSYNSRGLDDFKKSSVNLSRCC